MSQLHVRLIFSPQALARLSFDEPVSTTDPSTGIELTYAFEPMTGGILRLTGGLLREQEIIVGCEPDDINRIAGLLIDGTRYQGR